MPGSRFLCTFSFLILLAGCQSTEELGVHDGVDATLIDNRFLVAAALTNMTEIQTGRAALNRSQNPQVRELAKMMIDDHLTASETLQQLAVNKGASLPPRLNRAHQATVDILNNETGSRFDHDYIALQINIHQSTIEEIRKEAEYGNDPDIRALARQLLPTLQHHLQLAQSAQRSLL